MQPPTASRYFKRVLFPAGLLVLLAAVAIAGLSHTGAGGLPQPPLVAAGVICLLLVAACAGFVLTERRARRCVEAERALAESEERFRQIAENINAVFYLRDPDVTRMYYVSPAYETIWGRPVEGIYQRPGDFLEAVHPDDLDRMRDEMLQIGSGQREAEYRVIRPDGTVRWVHDRNFPVTDESGNVFRIVGIAEDITAPKEAEEALLESQKEFERLVDSLDDIVYSVDIETGEYRFLSEAFTRHLGYTEGDIRDAGGRLKLLSEIILGNGFFEQQEALGGLIAAAGESPDREGRKVGSWFRCKNGDLKRFEDSWTPVFEDGRLVRTDGVMRDITTRVRVEEALRERTAELERSNEELQEFAYVASHDLQEPLRSVTSFLQLLQRRSMESLDGKSLGYIDRAVAGAERMKRLINDLLQFSRVTTQANPFQRISLAGVFGEVEAALHSAIQESGARIEWPESPPAIVADVAQIARLFQNLVANAIKFSSDEAPRIRVSAERLDAGWRLSVADNGIGIAPEFHDRIFRVFQRLHARDEYPGTGIGLAVCRKIVQRHGGEIGVRSTEGKCATFWFTIPDIPEPPAVSGGDEPARTEEVEHVTNGVS